MVFLVESIQRDKYTELILFQRDKDGKKSYKIVKDFRPRFFVPESDPVPEDRRITGVKSGYKDIDNNPVKKIYTQKSVHVPELRDRFSKHYEADILFTHRYIINRIGPIEPYPLKILYIDIELNTVDSFPDMFDPDQEIVTISMVDSFDNREILLYYESPECKKPIKETETIKKFKTEEDLLNAFIVQMQKYDPDVITGWNIEKFDLTYLIRRMEKLGLNYRKLSPLYSVRIDEKWGDVMIKGRVILDMMKGYKYFRKISNQGRAESYSLEYTAQEVLKKGKIPHKDNFHDMWINSPEKLIEYNKRDTLLVKEINDTLNIIDFFNSIRCKACAQLRDIYSTSKLTDGFLLRKCRDKYVLPSGNRNISDIEKYSGAIVIKPTPGIYKNVIGLDISSMYPNLMKTFNIGYETFNPDGEIQLADGIGFNNGIGLISETLRELEQERNYWKKKMRKAAIEKDEDKRQLYYFNQYAVKVITNAIYGYLGYPRSRLYKKEVAGAVTTAGRELIMYTKRKVEELGYKVLYGDTDSVYVQAKSNGLIPLLTEGKKLCDILNKSYKDFAKERGAKICTLSMKFEKALKSIMFVSKRGENVGAKKKYAYLPLWIDGKNVEDKVEFTGFETIRSDTPRIGRLVQKKVVDMVLHGVEKEKVLEYLRDLDRKIRNKEIPDEEIGFPKGISSPLRTYGKQKRHGKTNIRIGIPPVVKGALYANKYLGKRYGQGSKPKWIYVKRVSPGFPETDVITYDEFIPEGFIPDYDAINKRIFDFKLSEIFRAAGWGDFPELNQNTLNKWGM